MNEVIEQIITTGKIDMKVVIKNLQNKLVIYQAGRANPDLVNNIVVECYGTKMPLKQIANVSIPDAYQILIKPYNPQEISNICAAISQSKLHLNPQVESQLIRLTIPHLTEEVRANIAKDVHKEEEHFKIQIRNLRRHMKQQIKKEANSDEERSSYEKTLQTLTDKFAKQINQLVNDKMQDIMSM